jgi:thymidylate synthase
LMCLGLVFNMPQTVWLLRVVAQITSLKPGKVFHKLVNCHLYDDQIDLMREQLTRKPFDEPTLHISDSIKSLSDLETWVNPQDETHFWVEGYDHHPAIKYPFAS